MSSNIDELKKKIMYRSNYRGTKEMDKLLGKFVKKYINDLHGKDLIDLDKFLNIDDTNLYNFYNGFQTDFEIKKKEQQNQNVEASKSEIGWGHQIRSYILQPYRLVKDNRTNHESTSPDKVLDGEIDEFLEKSLHQTK